MSIHTATLAKKWNKRESNKLLPPSFDSFDFIYVQFVSGLPNQQVPVHLLSQGLGCHHHECQPAIPADKGSLLEHSPVAYLLDARSGKFCMLCNNVCLLIVKVHWGLTPVSNICVLSFKFLSKSSVLVLMNSSSLAKLWKQTTQADFFAKLRGLFFDCMV
jgi:hypothetical protein